MANLDNLQENITLFNSAYAEHFKSPEVLATLLKTFTSHNITIEDWNTLVDTLHNNLELSPKMTELFNNIVDCLDEVYDTLENLDNKVDKSSTPSILYGTDSSGNQTIFDISDETDEAGTIVQRNDDGHIVAGPNDNTTFSNNEAITKIHLESRLSEKVDITDTAKKVYGTDSSGDQTTISYSDTSNDSLIIRKSDGSIYLGTAPTYTTDAANKQYVDGAIAQAIENVNVNSYVVIDIEEYPTKTAFLEGFPADEGIIYLYPLDTSEAPDFESGYEQYIWENNNWLYIGKTIIDLSGYWQKDSDINVGQHTVTAKKFYLNNSSENGQEASIEAYDGDIVISSRGGNIVIAANDDTYIHDTTPGNKIATEGRVVKHQVSTIFILDPLTNISGRAFQNFTSEDVTVDGHSAVKILKNSTKISEEDAALYMEYMTGSVYVPKYNYDKPKYTYFLDPNGQVYKPQYDSTNGLLLYKMSIVSTKTYTDTQDALKVDKTDFESVLYGTDDDGEQTTVVYTSNIEGLSIVQRDQNGQINLPGGQTSPTHAASKGYVDSCIAQAISNVYKYIGTRTVAELNALSGTALHNGDVYNVSDAGTLTSGSVQVIAGDNVAWTGSAWDKLANDIDWTAYDEKFMSAGFFEIKSYNDSTGEITMVYATDLYDMSYNDNTGVLTIEAN